MRYWRLLALLAAAAAVWAGTLGVPFVFHDQTAIVSNLRIRELWPAPAGAPWPVLEWTFALDYALGGLAVAGYHLTNVALHAACGLVLLDLARRSLEATGVAPARARVSAWWAALLFLVHPLQSEAVTLVTGRAEVLAGLALLAMLDLALIGERAPRWRGLAWTGAALAAGLGMAAGPTMLAAPLALAWLARSAFARPATLRVSYGGQPAAPTRPRRWPLWAGVLVAWGLALALVLSRVHPGTVLAAGTPPLVYLRAQLGVTAHYLRLFVWPDDLTIDYAWPAGAPGVGAAFAWAAVAVALAWLARRGPRAAALWLGLALLPLVPTSTLLPLADVAAERRMYASVAGLAVLAALAGTALARRRPGRVLAPVAAVVVVLALAAATMARIQVWRDPVALWQDALARTPAKQRVFRELAASYVRRGDHVHAARVVAAESFALERALAARPSDPDLLVALGKAYALQGRVSEALAVARRAVRLAPTDPAARAELGALLLAQADPQGAVAQLEIAEALVAGRRRWIDPVTLRTVWTNLGWAYASVGRTDEALAVLRRATDGDDVNALESLGSILGLLGAWDDARAVLERANAKDPTNVTVQRNLGWVYANLGRFAEANALLERAILREPNEPRTHGSLGWVRLRSGRPAGALHALTIAAELEPDNAKVLVMLGIARARLGEWQAAAAAFARAVKLAPDSPLARENLNRARLRQPPILPPNLP